MRIGVVRYWAGRPAAEHEVIARIDAAAQSHGHELVELNPDGTLLDDSTAFPEGLGFILNLHFSSPKIRDFPHVGVLWNPVQFYHTFGYNPHFYNQVSHDYLVTCGAHVVDRAFAPFRPDLSWSDMPVLNHSVPARYLEPVHRTDRRLFYIGINWERMSGAKGRHERLLTSLDAANLSSIHGPRQIDGIAPWAGFQTYQGDIPFDGWSVVEAISKAGAALIVSSPAHYRDGVMSSRPFEAAAAGVPLVSEHHPFMLEHFKDAALFFDERASEQEQAEQIAEILGRVNGEPDFALEMSARAQEILRTKFNLDDQVNNLCEWVTLQEQRPRARKASATAVVVPSAPPEDALAWIRDNSQVLSRFGRVVLAPPIHSAQWERVAGEIGPDAQLVVGTRSDTSWSARAGAAARDVEGPLSFLMGNEKLYRSYPEEVAKCESARIIPAVTVPPGGSNKANARLPQLLCGSTRDPTSTPICAVAATGGLLRELQDLLGPGAHLGMIAAIGSERDARSPSFVPAFSVEQKAAKKWSVGGVTGDELWEDLQYARSLPPEARSSIPDSVTRVNAAFSGDQRDPAEGNLAARVSSGFTLEIGDGFSKRESGRTGSFWWATSDVAVLVVKNLSKGRRGARLTFTPKTANGSPPRTLRVIWPNGSQTDAIPVTGKPVTLDFGIDKGKIYEIKLSSSGEASHVGNDHRDLWFMLTEVAMVPAGPASPSQMRSWLRRFRSRLTGRRRFGYQP